MSDPRNVIQRMFEDPNRYDNFGSVIVRVRAQGFRCHTDTIIEIASPITAFCGLNGTGKSTLLQLLAVGYRSPDPAMKHYCISDFLVVGTLDPDPFTSQAFVEFKYWQKSRSSRTVTLSRHQATSRWSGYTRRPKRHVFFAGVGLYLPRVEKRDFVVRQAKKLRVLESQPVPDSVQQWICKILSQYYNNITSKTVAWSGRVDKVTSVQRGDIEYSESHMGYGEGRTQYLIDSLETLPDKSLVLIEEPETSLHPSAEYEFGRYLVDVVKRKKHQIFLTTHSEFVLKALPSQSRVYLKKSPDGIDAVPNLSALQAKSLMAEGHEKALHILVEDDCAKALLNEIIRRIDPDFLRSIGTHPAGDANLLGKIVLALEDTGLSVAVVRDADKAAEPSHNIFKLPGAPEPPEKQLFADTHVRQYVLSAYGINLNDFAVALSDVDHHDWFKRLAEYVGQNEAAIVSEVARIYASSIPEIEASALVDQLKDAVQI